MKIDGIEYELVKMELDDPFDRCDALKKGQAVRYFDKYIYKTHDGKAKRAMQTIQVTIGTFN